MQPAQEVDYVLNDCFFAVGQAWNPQEPGLRCDSVVRTRYRAFFLHAMTVTGTPGLGIVTGVTAVGRFLGSERCNHSGDRPSIEFVVRPSRRMTSRPAPHDMPHGKAWLRSSCRWRSCTVYRFHGVRRSSLRPPASAWRF